MKNAEKVNGVKENEKMSRQNGRYGKNRKSDALF